jgi:hypothetical protein
MYYDARMDAMTATHTAPEPVAPDAPTEEWVLCPDAAVVVGITEQAMRQIVQRGRVTTARTDRGQRLIYLPSLCQYMKTRRRSRREARRAKWKGR